MMNKFKVIIIILTAVMTAAPSCVRDVSMDAKEKPQVVVNYIMSNDSVQTLNLSFTKGASLQNAPSLTDAVAALYCEDRHVGNFVHRDNGEWTLDYAAVPGKNYRLEVQVPGYGPIHAEQQMPPEPDLEALFYNKMSPYVEPWSGWIEIPWDPENQNGSIFGDTIYSWPEDEIRPAYEVFYFINKYSAPIWLCIMNYNEKTGRHEIAEDIYTDAYADDLNITDRVYVTLSKDEPNPYKLKKQYEKTILAETFYSAHHMELYPNLAGKPCYKSFLRIPRGEQMFSLVCSYEGDYCESGGSYNRRIDNMEDIENKGYLLCAAVSEDYDKYLIEAYNYQQIQESTDLSTIYLRDNIYTNITGGLGIFGAQVISRYPWAPTYTYMDAGITRNLEDYIREMEELTFTK